MSTESFQTRFSDTPELRDTGPLESFPLPRLRGREPLLVHRATGGELSRAHGATAVESPLARRIAADRKYFETKDAALRVEGVKRVGASSMERIAHIAASDIKKVLESFGFYDTQRDGFAFKPHKKLKTWAILGVLILATPWIILGLVKLGLSAALAALLVSFVFGVLRVATVVGKSTKDGFSLGRFMALKGTREDWEVLTGHAIASLVTMLVFRSFLLLFHADHPAHIKDHQTEAQPLAKGTAAAAAVGTAPLEVLKPTLGTDHNADGGTDTKHLESASGGSSQEGGDANADTDTPEGLTKLLADVQAGIVQLKVELATMVKHLADLQGEYAAIEQKIADLNKLLNDPENGLYKQLQDAEDADEPDENKISQLEDLIEKAETDLENAGYDLDAKEAEIEAQKNLIKLLNGDPETGSPGLIALKEHLRDLIQDLVPLEKDLIALGKDIAALERELDQLETKLDNAQTASDDPDNDPTVKDLEQQKAGLEKQLEKLNDDAGKLQERIDEIRYGSEGLDDTINDIDLAQYDIKNQKDLIAATKGEGTEDNKGKETPKPKQTEKPPKEPSALDRFFEWLFGPDKIPGLENISMDSLAAKLKEVDSDGHAARALMTLLEAFAPKEFIEEFKHDVLGYYDSMHDQLVAFMKAHHNEILRLEHLKHLEHPTDAEKAEMHKLEHNLKVALAKIEYNGDDLKDLKALKDNYVSDVGKDLLRPQPGCVFDKDPDTGEPGWIPLSKYGDLIKLAPGVRVDGLPPETARALLDYARAVGGVAVTDGFPLAPLYDRNHDGKIDSADDPHRPNSHHRNGGAVDIRVSGNVNDIARMIVVEEKAGVQVWYEDKTISPAFRTELENAIATEYEKAHPGVSHKQALAWAKAHIREVGSQDGAGTKNDSYGATDGHIHMEPDKPAKQEPLVS